MKGIDLTVSVEKQREKIERELTSGMRNYIIRQDEALEAIIRVVINGLFNVYRDQGALWAVFLGWPTGVWKTELARSLARFLLWDPNAFIKLCGEDMLHPSDTAKLTGAPTGYVWYGDTPKLADTRVHAGYRNAKEKWKLHPLLQGYNAVNFSIVLVDEVEKAHSDIPNAFLNAIQSWEIEMASGKESAKNVTHSTTTDLRNTLFIFTSNVGEHLMSQSKSKSIGFTSDEAPTQWEGAIFQKELRKKFAPEFIGRMDAIVRCHSMTQEDLRKIFELQTAQMNDALEKKGYYSSLRIATTRNYVDNMLAQAKWIEYGARAIAGVVKDLGSQTGFAIQSGKIPKEANGVIQFDFINDKPVISYVHGSTIKEHREITSESIKTILTPEHARNLIEWKINGFGEKVRETVREYLKLISFYDTGFHDACRVLERRLRGFWFSTKDIRALQATAFIEVYQSVEQPDNYEVIVRSEDMFSPVWFRAIEKYIRSAIIQSFSLSSIYQTIRVLLKKPMTRDEMTVISQHIHCLLQGRIQTHN